jgi:hypothetical protein
MFAQTVFSSAAIAASTSFFVPHFNCSFCGGFLLSVLICIQNTQVVLF